MEIKLIILEADGTIFRTNEIIRQGNNEDTKYLLKLLAKTSGDELIDTKTVEFLQALKKKYNLYLTSKEDEKFISLLLYRTNCFSIFSKIFAKHSVRHLKPSPEIYLRCLLRADIAPSECLIIDNSLEGQTSARAACIPILSLSSAMLELG